jgi:hypothetical protein
MSRKLLVLLALVLSAFTASARIRAASHPEPRSDGGTVSGTVSRVQGTLIEIANGAIAIDASKAKIVASRGREATAADIKPGMQLFAALRASNPAADGGLPAVLITVSSNADVTLNGAIVNVDAANRSFFLLNETIYVDDATSFGGYKREAGTSFADLQPNTILHVQADNVNGRLIAREVLVVAPAPPQVGHVRGTVKSIGADSWTVENEAKSIVTLTVNAQTKIIGSPKVGDTVEVLYHVDSAHNFVAVSIVKFNRVDPPQPAQFVGKVKSINGSAWVITTDSEDRKFVTNERTLISPNIVVGDRVAVIALRDGSGVYTAISVLELPTL